MCGECGFKITGIVYKWRNKCYCGYCGPDQAYAELSPKPVSRCPVCVYGGVDKTGWCMWCYTHVPTFISVWGTREEQDKGFIPK
jgi:hypothetical protein